MKTQTKKLATVLSLGALNGAVPVAALSGMFKPENAVMLAIAFMAGPGAIITAILLDGSARERMFAALLAGIIATLLVILAAGIGPKLLSLLNLNTIRIAGGISILAVSLIIMGIKIPENSPIVIMILGIIAGAIWR